jgi:hypothetical protein
MGDEEVAILVTLFNETRFAEFVFRSIGNLCGYPNYIMAVNNSNHDISKFRRKLLQQGLIDHWLDTGVIEHGEGLQQGFERVRAFRYIATIDSDAVGLKEGWLATLINLLKNSCAGLVGPMRSGADCEILASVIHPCCMVIDQNRIQGKFPIDFRANWPFWDAGGLLSWGCLLYGIPTIKVSHEYSVRKDTSAGSSLVNDSVRHYWYVSRIFSLSDEEVLDGALVKDIRQRLEKEYNSNELTDIRNLPTTVR